MSWTLYVFALVFLNTVCTCLDILHLCRFFISLSWPPLSFFGYIFTLYLGVYEYVSYLLIFLFICHDLFLFLSCFFNVQYLTWSLQVFVMVSLYLRYGLFESLSWSLYIFVMVSLHFRHGLFLYICHGLFISSLLVTFYLFVYICLLSISRICPVFVPVYLVIKIFIFLLIFASSLLSSFLWLYCFIVPALFQTHSIL